MKRIYITVDTECHDINWQDRYIWGKTRKGEYWGLDKILSLGKELKIPINFFVDVPEAKQYGDGFTSSIIDKIHAAGQKAYIHLHPNYITGEKEQTFFWKYTKQEKKAILLETKEIAQRFLTEQEMIVFRIGRYGADPQMYDVLRETLGQDVIDFSYCYNSAKMCHVGEQEVNTKNAVTRFKDILLFPNTRYIGFRLGNKSKTFNLDTAETTFGEFKAIIDQNALENITLTMHSWNFIKVFFFNKNRVWADRGAEKKFRRMVRYAQEKGYVFSDIAGAKHDILPSKNEQVIDLCATPMEKAKAFIANFVRFQHTARLTKKYFILYTLFYSALALITGGILFMLLS